MEYIPVTMVRGNLMDIPQFPLPPGYSMRMYRPGDEASWLRLWQQSEPFKQIAPETFQRAFGDDLPAMRKRCFFLVAPDGADAGTITAWYDRRYGKRRWGRIHWVCVVPEHQGKGLCKPMMTVAMNRFRSLGHRRAMLVTQTPRLRAIKVYLDFGFVPDMTADRAHDAWQLVALELHHPALAAFKRHG